MPRWEGEQSWLCRRFYKGVTVRLTEVGRKKFPRYAHLVGEVIARPFGANVRVWWGVEPRTTSQYIPKEWVEVYQPPYVYYGEPNAH